MKEVLKDRLPLYSTRITTFIQFWASQHRQAKKLPITFVIFIKRSKARLQRRSFYKRRLKYNSFLIQFKHITLY